MQEVCRPTKAVRAALLVAAFLSTISVVDSLRAQEVVKANNTDALNLGSSWVGGTAPTSSNVAVWNSTITASNTTAPGADISLAGLKIVNPTGAVAINAGNTLTLGASGINMAASMSNLTINAALVLSEHQTWSQAGSRMLTVGGAVNNGGYTLTISNTAPITNGFFNTYLNGIVSGTGGLVKNGSGSLTMGLVAHSFTGDVTLNEGLLNAGNSATALGSGGSRLTLNGGTLTARASSARSFGRNTTINGNVSFYNNNSAQNGAMAYTFGTLSIGEHTFTVTANGSGTGSLTYGATTLTGNATFEVGSRSTNFLIVGAVGESGVSRGLTKTGVGTMNITGASTYTGTTAISGGVLALTGAGSLSSSSPILNDGTLDITAITSASTSIGRLSGSGSVLIGGKTLTLGGSGDSSFSGTITGSTGGVTKQTEGFQTLSGANTYSGMTTISQGGLVIASTGALPGWNTAGRFSVANGATLAVGNTVADADVATLATTGNFAAGSRLGFDTSAGNREYSQAIGDTSSGALGLTKLGGNSLTLSGVNTFSGGLAVNDGSLVIGSINNAGANGTLGSGLSAMVLGSSSKRGTLSYTGASGSSSRAFSAAAGGTAAFEVTNSASTLTLSGLINGDGQKRFGGAGNFVLNGGLSGAGHVIKTGAGSLTLGATGTFSHTGTTTVEEGTLVVNGSLGTGDLTVLSGATLKGVGTINGFTTIEGTHSPGNSPGLETFADGLSYGSSSAVMWELSANTALSTDRGILYDGIDLTGGSLSIVPGASIHLVFNAALAGGGSSTVDWDDTFWASSQSWKVIDVQSGLWSPGVFTLGSIGVDASGQSLASSIRSGATFSVVQRDGGDIYVEYVIVPEPTTLVVAGIGIALAGWSLRRRRRIA